MGWDGAKQRADLRLKGMEIFFEMGLDRQITPRKSIDRTKRQSTFMVCGAFFIWEHLLINPGRVIFLAMKQRIGNRLEPAHSQTASAH
jgi:hypothetical protein